MHDPSSSNLRTGGQILVDCLGLHGVDKVFCVPGESYLATLDAFHDVQDKIELVVCRQEGGATNMADAWGKMTGKPGIAFVTRGPGATNASVGVHTARQDSTPLILFVGQVAREMAEREAFQEVDYRRMFGEMTKWVAQIDDAARIPEMVSRAFHVATSGRPGPVVLALPEDMQTERADAVDGQVYHSAQASCGATDMEKFRDMLSAAKKPLVFASERALIKTEPLLSCTAWFSLLNLSAAPKPLAAPRRHVAPASSESITLPWTLLFATLPVGEAGWGEKVRKLTDPKIRQKCVNCY